MGAQDLGGDLVAGLWGEPFDLVKATEPDQHLCDQEENPIVRHLGDCGVQVVHRLNQLFVRCMLLAGHTSPQSWPSLRR